MVFRLSTASRNTLAAALAGLADAGAGPGKIELRTGAQPATPQVAASGTLLATIVLGDPAFGAPATGVIAAADPAPVTGVAAGDAGWFRLYDSNNVAIADGSVTATGGGGDITLATVTVSVGLTVDMTAFSINIPQ